MKALFILTVFAAAMFIVGGTNVSAQAKSVAGEWNASMNTPGGTRPFDLIFKVDGEKLSGTVKRASGDAALSGTIKGDDIQFSYTISYNGNNLTLSMTGKVKGDNITGTVYFSAEASDEWSAKRAPAKKP